MTNGINPVMSNGAISPYKSKRKSATAAKKRPDGPQKFLIGDDDGDFNDRIAFDKSIKIVNPNMGNANMGNANMGNNTRIERKRTPPQNQ